MSEDPNSPPTLAPSTSVGQAADAAANDQWLHLILGTVEDYAIFTLDPSGMVTSWHRGAELTFGYAPAEIIGQNGAILWTRDDQNRGAPAEEMGVAREKGVATDERWHLRKNGTRFFAVGTMHALRNAQGELNGFTKICRNVTEQRRVEKELSEARSQLSSALVAGEIGTWVWDIPADRVFADKNLAKFFDVSPEDAAGGPLASYLTAIHPDDRAHMEEVLAESVRQGREFEVEYRLISSTGTRSVIARGRLEEDEAGAPLGMAGVVLDITQRKRAEEELRSVQDQLALAVEAAGLGIFHRPWPDGTMQCNARCREQFFLPPSGLLPVEMFYDQVHEADRQMAKDEASRAVEGHSVYDSEYRVIGPAGEVRWLRAIGRAYYNDAGEALRVDGVTMDVTDRRELDNRTADLLKAETAAREEAERTSRLKDEFLATLSHELRTPLNAILGWTHVLRSGTPDAEGLQQALNTIERNARAQTQIIEDLLDMSRIISGKVRLEMERLDIATVIAAAIETVRPAAEVKGIDIQTDFSREMPWVTADPDRLQQVFWNLLSNGIKFTPRGGHVAVALKATATDLEITVADTGQGIGGEFLPHVFERFRQADSSTTRQHGGLGLGLAIVKQLVELHGGTIRVQSEGAGHGTSFVVSLPLAPESADFTRRLERRYHEPPFNPLAVPGNSTRLQGVTVLVVDDELDARQLLNRVLHDWGATVLTASRAAEALEILRRDRPQVLVSDIGMPDEDGYTLIRQVRALPPEQGGATPAVALTAYARAEDRMKAVMAGYQMHVVKPVDPAELFTMVSSLAGRTA